VFLDPPYRQDLIPSAIARLRAVRRLSPAALIIAETERDEPVPAMNPLAVRVHGAAQLSIWRET
jgi:16S rRNA (guanine966-N2)-methyltransferase